MRLITTTSNSTESGEFSFVPLVVSGAFVARLVSAMGQLADSLRAVFPSLDWGAMIRSFSWDVVANKLFVSARLFFRSAWRSVCRGLFSICNSQDLEGTHPRAAGPAEARAQSLSAICTVVLLGAIASCGNAQGADQPVARKSGSTPAQFVSGQAGNCGKAPCVDEEAPIRQAQQMAVTRSEKVRTKDSKSCSVRVAVTRAEPLPDRSVTPENLIGLSDEQVRQAIEVSEIRRAQDGAGERLPAAGGLYLVSHAATSSDLKFAQSYVSEYAAKVEQSFIDLATQELCRAEVKELDIQITFLELSFFEPYDLELVPRYGTVLRDQSNKTVYGLFVWNPRQILADQYWLHFGLGAPNERQQLYPEPYKQAERSYDEYLDAQRSSSPLPMPTSHPPDLMWFFKQTPQHDEFLAFGTHVKTEMEIMLSESEPGYSMISGELIRIGLDSGVDVSELSLKEIRNAEIFETYKYDPSRRAE